MQPVDRLIPHKRGGVTSLVRGQVLLPRQVDGDDGGQPDQARSLLRLHGGEARGDLRQNDSLDDVDLRHVLRQLRRDNHRYTPLRERTLSDPGPQPYARLVELQPPQVRRTLHGTCDILSAMP